LEQLVASVSLVKRVCRFTNDKSLGGVILPQLNAVQNVKQLTALLSKRIPRARKKAADRVLSFAYLLPDVTKVFYPDHCCSP